MLTRKVPGETVYCHHLLIFVMCQSASEVALGGPAMVPCREGDGDSWKVLTKALFHLHLLDFVVNRLTSEALPTNFVRVALPSPCRNGSKSRDSVPLWKWLFRNTLAVGLLDGIAHPFPCRNGSKSRESVPLWKCLFCSTLLQAFWTALSFRLLATTAAKAVIWCRCGSVFFAVLLL